LLTDACGRIGEPCRSGECVARTVGRLRERRWREKLGLFACEGEDLVAAATAEPVELLVAGENVSPKLPAEVSSAAHPPRVIGVYRRSDLPAPASRPCVLALWRVADPGNIGTLIRTADAFGAAVALSDGCADPTGPKALRASAGAVWRVPLLRFADNACGASDEVPGDGKPGHKRVALTSGGGLQIGEAELSGPVTFLLGAEREGLPAEIERDLDAWIPIDSESLNVAAAGAIALYEWRRQN
jgi:RNA methyltransferase, TrmH family